MLGTKCPSITSRWIQSAPAESTARTSSPNLAKSDAKIDGAMTRGRDANCWDMCAFSGNHFRSVRSGFRVTRASLAGNAGETAHRGRKFLPQRHQLPGQPDGLRDHIPRFYWFFRDGTAFADPYAAKVKGRAMRHWSEFSLCCLLLASCRPRWTPSNR